MNTTETASSVASQPPSPCEEIEKRWRSAWDGVQPEAWHRNAYYQNKDYLLPSDIHRRMYGWC